MQERKLIMIAVIIDHREEFEPGRGRRRAQVNAAIVMHCVPHQRRFEVSHLNQIHRIDGKIAWQKVLRIRPTARQPVTAAAAAARQQAAESLGGGATAVPTRVGGEGRAVKAARRVATRVR